jgi:hypothetical protein
MDSVTCAEQTRQRQRLSPAHLKKTPSCATTKPTAHRLAHRLKNYSFSETDFGVS